MSKLCSLGLRGFGKHKIYWGPRAFGEIEMQGPGFGIDAEIRLQHPIPLVGLRASQLYTKSLHPLGMPFCVTTLKGSTPRH